VGAQQEAGTYTTPRVVYLILSHRNPAQVERLVAALGARNEGSHVVVHHNPRDPEGTPRVTGADRVHLFPARPLEWGDFSPVGAFLRCVDWIERSLAYDWVVFISGQDYPIKPIRQIEQTLASSEFDGYLSPSILSRAPEMMDRYAFRYVGVPGGERIRRLAIGKPGRLIRRFESFRLVTTPPDIPPRTLIGIKRRRTIFSDDFPCRVGVMWMMIRRRCVQTLLGFVRDRPDYVAYLRRSFIPDEAFYHTIFLNDPQLRIARYPLRFMRWSEDGSHPEVLTTTDLDDLKGSPALFARKFDTRVDPAVLDALDAFITRA
jgi:core-2/I-Branching enzyme